MNGAAFGPDWLATRLTALLPGFPRSSICVAFSGGGDSMALLSALAELRNRRGLRLRAIHVDHRINPASGAWAESCVAAGVRWRIPVQVDVVDVRREPGQSLEAAAREARYECFARHLGPGENLLTAHHLDDQAETVLLQLLRGAGVAGLAAMPERSPFAAGWLVRPLLELDRARLREWLGGRGQAFVDDPSNDDPRFDRNALRHTIMPAILARWPGATAAFARAARHAAAAKRMIDVQGRADADAAAHGDALCVKRLRTMPAERRSNAIRTWLRRQGFLAPDTRQLAEIAGALLRARDDASPHVRLGGCEVHRHGDRLVALAPIASAAGPGARAAQAPREWTWQGQRTLPLGGANGSIEIVADAHGPLDLARLPPVLVLRARAGGERLRVRAGGPRRALKSLLQEARVPPWERRGMPLIFANDVLIAAGDRWLAAEVAADRSSVSRARIVWHRSPALR